ncbi:hypothetical protein GGR58DRAFT_492734 [Xylaria digitata]|nr:hypothetical protein GGR58DRAFT_492734 [Xylaria digitata]
MRGATMINLVLTSSGPDEENSSREFRRATSTHTPPVELSPLPHHSIHGDLSLPPARLSSDGSQADGRQRAPQAPSEYIDDQPSSIT